MRKWRIRRRARRTTLGGLQEVSNGGFARTLTNETDLCFGRWSEVGISQWCNKPDRKSDPESHEYPGLLSVFCASRTPEHDS
jgi:hypothetical protein